MRQVLADLALSQVARRSIANLSVSEHRRLVVGMQLIKDPSRLLQSYSCSFMIICYLYLLCVHTEIIMCPLLITIEWLKLESYQIRFDSCYTY